MIFGVRKHSNPEDVENYDSRIALFGNISGILNMAAFSERACDVALDILKPLVSDSNRALARSRNHLVCDSCRVPPLISGQEMHRPRLRI